MDMPLKTFRRQRNQNGGFTFVELIFVMMISGVIMIAMLAVYDQYLKDKQIRQTRHALEESMAQISFFFAQNGFYPCPADRVVPVRHVNFGRAYGSNGVAADMGLEQDSCMAMALSIGAGNCSADGGVCVAQSLTDANKLVIIGGVPVITIRESTGIEFDPAVAFDAWGSRLTYAVTVSQTDLATYDADAGAISAFDEFGVPTAGIINDGHLVVLSHGPNRRGGFLEDGSVGVVCGAPADALDNENCNNDSSFFQALGYYLGSTAAQFDDFVMFAKSRSFNLWSFLPNTSDVRNRNEGNVGIGTDAPQKLLDVYTEPAATGLQGLLVDGNMVVDAICKKGMDPETCFPVRVITDPPASTNNIECSAPGMLMYGIRQAQAVCREPDTSEIHVNPNQTCPLGKWLHGFRHTGEIICWPED